MNWQDIIIVLQAVGIVGLLTAILMHQRELPKARAEAVRLLAEAARVKADTERLEVETDGMRLNGLAQEIGRLQERAKQQDEQIEALRKDVESRITHEAKLEQENRSLRTKVQRMERRITGLETIFKLHPVTPAMQAELDKLEREDLEA